MRARTEENVFVVDELALSKEDQPQIHHSAHQTAQSAVILDHFYTATLV